MKINRAIKILTLLVVIAFCLVQTRYQNEPSSSIISAVCFLLKDMNWSEMSSNHNTLIFGVTAIGIFVLNILILIAAFLNKRGFLFGVSLLHIGFWGFIWNFYGWIIIAGSAIPYLILITILVTSLVILWSQGKMNKMDIH